MNLLLPRLFRHLSCPPGPLCKVLGSALAYYFLGRVSHQLLPASNSLLESLFLPEGAALATGVLLGPIVAVGVLLGHLALMWLNDFSLVYALSAALANAAILLCGLWGLRLLRFSPTLPGPHDYLMLVLVISLLLQPMSRGLGWALLVLATDEPFAWQPMLESLDWLALEKSVCEALVCSTILVLVDTLRNERSLRQWLTLAGGSLLLALALQHLFLREQAATMHALQVISLLYLAVMVTTAIFELQGAVISCLMVLAAVQLAAQSQSGAFFSLVGASDGQYYFNVFLAGIVYSAGLLGALLREKSAHEQQLQHLADRDYLTGIANRRHFCDIASRELSRVRRSKASVALLWIDIDHFKRINDTHGHAVGDDVLVFFADVLRKHTREADMVARLGGEEFAVLALDTTDLSALAERFRRALSESLLAQPARVSFTVSIGATLFHPDDAEIDVAFHRADLALYRAKEAGRDRAVIDP